VPALASAQADKAYGFDERQAIPDLAVEMVMTGERETKLKRYEALRVPEVRVWIDQAVWVYQLDEERGEYIPVSHRVWLPGLNLQRLAIAATQEFRADAIQAFLA
jgi:Uma2 family endonuclease